MDKSKMKFSKSHEWVYLENDIAIIGITDYAQQELNDIVYVDLPPIGKIINIRNEFGVVESVKTATDLYSPLSGEIIEINKLLANNPELINQDPYGKGWMIKIKLSNKSELDNLMDENTYLQLIQTK